MKRHQQRINEEIDLTFKALDEIQRVDVSPFLYTRIKEKRKQDSSVNVAIHQSNNRWQLAIFGLLLLINSFTVLNSSIEDNPEAVISEVFMSVDEIY